MIYAKLYGIYNFHIPLCITSGYIKVFISSTLLWLKSMGIWQSFFKILCCEGSISPLTFAFTWFWTPHFGPKLLKLNKRKYILKQDQGSIAPSTVPLIAFHNGPVFGQHELWMFSSADQMRWSTDWYFQNLPKYMIVKFSENLKFDRKIFVYFPTFLWVHSD